MGFRVVMVGCGQMANAWADYVATRSDVDIVGLVDVVPENADNLRARHRLEAEVYSNLEQALAHAKPDVVFDVAIPESRRAIVGMALESGCHVFSEKPMALNLKDAKDLVNVAGRTGKVFAVMQNRRYDPRIRALTDLVQGGSIGIPGWVTANFFLGPHFGGFREVMEHPLLLDMAIHTFDQARLILGKDPVSVFCHEFNPGGSWYRGNAAAACIFEFADGQVFTYQGSWCAPGAPTSWEADWRIIGSRGTALWDGVADPYAEVVDATDTSFQPPAKRVEASLSWSGRSGHFGCLDAMFGALVSGGRPETDCTDNVKSLAMVLASIESAERNAKVPVRWQSIVEPHRR